MKAIFEFKLPEEKVEHEHCRSYSKFYAVIFDMLEHLRYTMQYTELTEKEFEIYDKIKKELWDKLTENNIDHLF